VIPRAGLDDVEKIKFLTLPGLEFRPLGRPARSQSVYRLRYPGVEIFLQVHSENLSAAGEENVAIFFRNCTGTQEPLVSNM
jgi:hypothetical protein